MRQLVARVRELALAWGAPGLFAVAFLDSSFLPLPGVADLLLIVMVTRRAGLAALYVVAAIAGSVVGCLLVYEIGRKGGEALVRRRFAGPRVERAMASLQRHGIMAVLIPCLLPPPAPFKIFLLLAGAAGISATRFGAAIAIGRGLRYTALALLAIRYGSRATAYLVRNGTKASLVIVAVIVVGFVASQVWAKAKSGWSR